MLRIALLAAGLVASFSTAGFAQAQSAPAAPNQAAATADEPVPRAAWAVELQEEGGCCCFSGSFQTLRWAEVAAVAWASRSVPAGTVSHSD